MLKKKFVFEHFWTINSLQNFLRPYCRVVVIIPFLYWTLRTIPIVAVFWIKQPFSEKHGKIMRFSFRLLNLSINECTGIFGPPPVPWQTVRPTAKWLVVGLYIPSLFYPPKLLRCKGRCKISSIFLSFSPNRQRPQRKMEMEECVWWMWLRMNVLKKKKII